MKKLLAMVLVVISMDTAMLFGMRSSNTAGRLEKALVAVDAAITNHPVAVRAIGGGVYGGMVGAAAGTYMLLSLYGNSDFMMRVAATADAQGISVPDVIRNVAFRVVGTSAMAGAVLGAAGGAVFFRR